jgi:hypothetical protein
MLNTKFEYKALNEYIDNKNWMRSLFGEAEFDIDNLTQADINELVDSLNSDFSPENLHCDGEISPAQAQRKFDSLEQVVLNMNHLTYVRGLNLPKIHMYG